MTSMDSRMSLGGQSTSRPWSDVGRSQIIGPSGYQLAGLVDEQGQASNIDPGRLARARETLPVLAQRRRHLMPTTPSA